MHSAQRYYVFTSKQPWIWENVNYYKHDDDNKV